MERKKRRGRMRDWWIACQRAGSHVRSSRVVCRTLITLMNGVGCASRYRRFTASVTLTIPKREGQSTQGAEKKRRRQKKKEDLMLVDITRLYYHHFTAPTKLIESAPPPCTESSSLLAGPPSLHFLFFPPVTEHFTFDTWLTQTHTEDGTH